MPDIISILAVADSSAHPMLSTHAQWSGVMLIVIAALFLAAMVIGPIVRLHSDDVHHDPHSH